MKKLSFLFFLILTYSGIIRSENIDWIFETESKINATAVIENGIVYIGSDDMNLYAINAASGAKLWSYQTEYAIKSEPLVLGNTVYLTVGESLHLINKHSGTKIHFYQPEAALNNEVVNFIDAWDYHDSSPIEHDGKIYFGDAFGNIQVYDTISNTGSVFYTTEKAAAIRTTINISNNVMYFGDWEGVVYALDLITKELLWQYKTFETRPYDSFGPIITQPVINNNILYVGARNYTFTAINLSDGTKTWDYTDANGGWHTGTPLIINDTLYLGGSDNKELIAFNANTGEKLWAFESFQNIFCKPIYKNGYILFTDGNSYNHNAGVGYLYAVNTTDGKAKNIFSVKRNIYSSPKISSNKLYFGSYDYKVYCFDVDLFLNPQEKNFSFPVEPVSNLLIDGTNDEFFSISIQNDGEGLAEIEFSFESANTEIPEACKFKWDNLQLPANDEVATKLLVDKNYLSVGKHELTIKAINKASGEIIYSKTCTIEMPETSNIKQGAIKKIQVYPNPATTIINCNFALNETADINASLCNIKGQKLLTSHMGVLASGNHSFTLNLAKGDFPQGIYLLAVNANSKLAVQKKIWIME